MEPKDKKSPEWRDWFVRHKFGGLTASIIKSFRNEDRSLRILQKFIVDIRNSAKKMDYSPDKAQTKGGKK